MNVTSAVNSPAPFADEKRSYGYMCYMTAKQPATETLSSMVEIKMLRCILNTLIQQRTSKHQITRCYARKTKNEF